MNIQIDNKKETKFAYTYEPILNEYIFYISRKTYINQKLIKFTFVNKKNESIVDPQLTTVYQKGKFFNVINLEKIRIKEKKNADNFLIFFRKIL